MPKYYAQIDASGKLVSVSALSGEVHSEFMIPLTQEQYENQALLYTRYVGGEFVGTNVTLTSDKTVIAPNGRDLLTIQAKVTDWQNKPLAGTSPDIILDVNGSRQTVKTVNGEALITLSSAEPGEYLVRTINFDRNAELKVVASDAL
ncbi:Ig-like domain-containing protein [Paenibacillus xanthanilyticus]|uniref:Uncharacterized protein n=1 Tax=Paenibacillus xanthanilyticus TaxID=1783531 RepID=A0ABV8K6S9_9BACL